MMSFLAEIIACAEKTESEQIYAKIPLILKESEEHKTKVIRYLEDVHVKFINKCNNKMRQNASLVLLQQQLIAVRLDMDQISNKELLEATDEVKKFKTKLAETDFALSVIQKLCEIHNDFIEVKDNFKHMNYVKSVKKLLDIEVSLESLPDECVWSIINPIKQTIIEEKQKMLNFFTNLFRMNFITEQEDNAVTIKIKKGSEQLFEALQALYLNNHSVNLLDNVTRFIWNQVCNPIVSFITEINIFELESKDYIVLKVIIVDTKKLPDYLDVFKQLKEVFGFLYSHMNCPLNTELTVLEYIGRDLRDNLSELIIKNCLQHTIPSTTEGLQEYKHVIEHTKELEDKLKDYGFFAEDTTSILEYANNIDILFINKKCREHLETARNIMKKDLHDLISVGTPYDMNKSILGANNEFLRCSVSCSAQELLLFVDKILGEMKTGSDVTAGRLFCTIQNIFSLYGKFVPEFHQKLLQSIPQQIALFHNNCMYIAHQLKDWKNIYKNTYPLISTDGLCFQEETLMLERVGEDSLKTFVNEQVKQIEVVLKQTDLQNKQTLDNLEERTEKCIRQCLRQQELLKTVWHKVLSYPVYNNALGTILDSMCSFLIVTLVKLEDIEATTAEQLVDILKLISNRGPKLFTDAKEIHIYVHSWYKFNELVFVLSANLIDINNRWADGKGPLALHFKPEELKQLIRSLFQNTDRRAALLNRIHS